MYLCILNDVIIVYIRYVIDNTIDIQISRYDYISKTAFHQTTLNAVTLLHSKRIFTSKE